MQHTLKSHLYVVLVFLFILEIHPVSWAQTRPDSIALWKYGLETGGSISFTGLNLKMNFLMSKGPNEWYVGPKLVLSDIYLPTQGPWGLIVGYRRNLLNNKRLKSFVNLDYQITFLKLYNPLNLPVSGMNNIHELFLTYGFQYQLNPHISVGQFIGGGGVLEKSIDISEQKTNRVLGYSGVFGLFVNYTFNNVE